MPKSKYVPGKPVRSLDDFLDMAKAGTRFYNGKNTKCAMSWAWLQNYPMKKLSDMIEAGDMLIAVPRIKRPRGRPPKAATPKESL